MVSVCFLIAGLVIAEGRKEAAPAEKTERITIEGRTKVTIGWSNASISNPWRIEMVRRVEEEAKKYTNLTLLITHAQDSAAKQISDCDDLLARGVDLLMLTPTSIDALNPVVDRAARQKIPLVLVQRETSNRNFTSLVWNDDIQLGSLAASEMVRLLGHAGKIAIIEGIPGASSTLGRSRGMKKKLELYPNIELLAALPGDYQEAKARSVMEDILTRYPDIDGVIVHSGTMARGALAAIRAAGKAGKIVIVSIGSENHVLKEIAKNNMHSTVMESVSVGVAGLRQAIAILENKPFRKLVPIESPIVNANNVDKWVRMDWADDTWVY
jgi:ribose transport system substrate-binding protein